MAKKFINQNLLYEVLVDFLPAFQKPYVDSKAYVALCDALMDYLKSTSDTRAEKRQILEHVKEIFDDMCMKMPRYEQPDPERTWTSINQ